MKTSSEISIKNIWQVFLAYDGRYDNNMFVRVPSDTAEEAVEIARKYVLEEGEYGDETITDPVKVEGNPDEVEQWEEFINDECYNDDPDYHAFLNGEIDGYCYDAGT